MSNLVVGLTGGIGVGKTTVTDLFSELGIDIIDADVIARESVARGSTALKEIVKRFGKTILNEQQDLNRSALRNIVFNDANEKQWLDNLLHPLIRQQIIQQVQLATSSYCILVAPLLIENQLTHLVHQVLVVDVDESIQCQRAANRDGSSKEDIAKIMKNQTDRKTRLAAADQVILNDGDKRQLQQKVTELHQFYQNQQKNYVKS
jgi:dephospho-CoA kinase